MMSFCHVHGMNTSNSRIEDKSKTFILMYFEFYTSALQGLHKAMFLYGDAQILISTQVLNQYSRQAQDMYIIIQ